ncbi:hypothetical protein CRE_09579 [Caenorhabditis remanei]|uniref:Uncharacterized protein n=1 Tax=Caenorhabditis remanei TaxID=31234 RepID=E3MIY9_CAERE|nr:hypothetical protein CRE_09579 [Caenorhabditis remanei]
MSWPTAQTREHPELLRSQPKIELPQCSSDSDPLFTELLSNFLISEGIPLEVSRDSTFQDLISHFNPKCVIPTENSMTEYVEKHYVKPLINYPKTIGPISVTIDIYGDLNEKFLVFSIHYFEDIYERKNAVYLKKISNNRINTLNTICRSVNNYSFRDVKFTNLVGSNQEILRMNGSRELVNQFHICFYRKMSKFVKNLLGINIFSHGLDLLRRFIRFIKGNPDLYRMFENFQSTRNQESKEPNLPSMDNDSWESTYIFLTKCLLLHESFADFCEQYKIRLYITNMVFKHLIHLQRLLRQCVYYCRSLSTPSSSISQIIPAIEGLRRLIDREFPFQQDKVLELLDSSFENYSRNCYEVAVLLDPLFSYTDIFPEEKWKDLENLVIEEFVKTNWKWTVHSGIQDATMMNSRERMTFISSEIEIYREFSIKERPEESDCPFLWWAERQSQFEFLSVMAREYFSCPAVSIDASFYFSEGGKLHRLSKMYSGQQLEQCLNLAGSHQEFRGKGASEDDITYSMIEKLDGLTRNSKSKIPYFQTIRKVVLKKPEPQLVVKKLDPEEPPKTAPIKRKRALPNPDEPKPPPRSHCTICKDLKQYDSLWYFGRTIERQILILGWLSRGFNLEEDITRIMRKKAFNVCPCHIRETIEEIYEKLGLKVPKDLYSCSMELFENMFNSVAHLSPGMTKEEFQEALFEFFVKYEDVKEELTRPKLPWNKVVKVNQDDELLESEGTSRPDEDEVDPLSADLMVNSKTTYDLSTPRNRRCTICRLLRGHGDIKPFRKESDRHLIIIGCLVGESINIRQAEALMKKTNIYVCNSHIEETHREILKKLCSEDLDAGSKEMMTTVTLLMPELKLSTLKRMLKEFLIKFNFLMSEEQKYVPKPRRAQKSQKSASKESEESEERDQSEENDSLDEGGETPESPGESSEESTSSAKKEKKKKSRKRGTARVSSRQLRRTRKY